MTKALRITSIVVAVIAVLLIALPPLFSAGIDEQKQKFLDTPGVLESFEASDESSSGDAVSPLVQQAAAFANYLDPPPPPRPPASRQPAQRRPEIRPTSQVSAKFDLVGTSYYALRPEMSMALIDEPGKGLRWVRQASEIGHLVVEEVKDGKVIIRDGTSTYEIQPVRPPKRSLIKGQSGDTTATADAPPGFTAPIERPSPPASRPSRRPAAATGSDRITRPARRTPQPRPTSPSRTVSPEETAIFDAFVREAQEAEDQEEIKNRMNELMRKLNGASQVSDAEAEQLEEMGEELEDANDRSR